MGRNELPAKQLFIYLPIRLNHRRGHQTDSKEPSAGISCFYAPNFEKVGDILVSACPCVCVCVCVCGGASRYRLETSCMDSSWKNSLRIFLVFPELSPLVKLRPFDKQGDEIL